MLGSLGQGKLDLENVTFLVVDDNRFMRSILKGLLHSFGAKQVVEADDGASALKELQSAAIDIVITDLMMDPLDGLDLTRLIRTSEDLKTLTSPLSPSPATRKPIALPKRETQASTNFSPNPYRPKRFIPVFSPSSRKTANSSGPGTTSGLAADAQKFRGTAVNAAKPIKICDILTSWQPY